MVDVLGSRDGEHLVKLFQGQGFGFRQTEIAKYPSKEVPRSIPAKCALRREGFDQCWPCEGDYEVKAPGSGGCKGHADIANVQGL